MAVNVDTGSLRSGGSEALGNLSACEGPYKGVMNCSSFGIASIESFKNALNSMFVIFTEHSNILNDRLHQCAECLEEYDNLIASGASGGQLASVGSLAFAGGTGAIVSATMGASSFISALETTTEEDDILDDLETTNKASEVVYSGSNLSPKNNINIAHRGYHPGGIYENSADAFREAGKNGFWGCETDVGFDANGNLICSHNSLALPETRKNPPSFEEYLEICKEYGMTAVIDLKYYGTYDDPAKLSSAVVEAVQKNGMLDSCVFQTNWVNDVPNIRQASDDARIWLLVDEVGSHKQLIADNNVECVNFNAAADNGRIAYGIKTLNENGIDSCVWGVLTEGGKNSWLNTGATYVMSDNLIGSTPYQEGQKDYNNIAN